MNILNRIKFSLFFILSILLFLFFIGCGSQGELRQGSKKNFSQDSAFRYYYQAMGNLEMGQVDSALTNLTHAIRLNPNYAQFYFVKGKIFELLQEPDSAIFYLEKSLRIKFHNPELWYELGKLYFNKQQYHKAIPFLERSIQQFPDSLNLYLDLGEAYFKEGKFRLAVDVLNDYERSTDNAALRFYKWMGMNLFELKEYQSAEQYLSHYVEQAPDDIDALKYLGMVRFQLGDYEDAISLLNKVATFRMQDPIIYLYRTRYFYLRQKPQIALEQLRIASSLDSTNSEILFELGKLKFELGDLNGSKTAFLKLKRISPRNWMVYRYLGLIEEIEGNIEQAIRYYSTYVQNSLTYDPEIEYKLEVLPRKIKQKK